MNTARSALERISSDPEAQRLAEESETAQLARLVQRLKTDRQWPEDI